MQKRTLPFALLLLGLFAFRLAYGLASEFWFDDELQIYLLGLKWFTTGTWPYLGPDVVYTHTQIPGALQGLLVGLPLFVAPVPEAPTVFLNVLTFASLSFFAWYLCRRFPGMPTWVVWSWVMIAPWTVNYGTRVVNPSYVLIFSVPFFVGFFETYLGGNRLLSGKTSLFLMGLATTCVMQLHLSWVLLIPFAALTLGFLLRKDRRSALGPSAFYGLGLLAGASTLIPTLLQDAVRTPSTLSNVTFDPANLGNLLLVLGRFFSFAGFDVYFWLGHDDVARREVITALPWMAPFVAFLFAVGCLQVLLFVAGFFRRDGSPEWRKLAWVTLGAVAMTWAAFFFSVKGPDSHTFCILLPLAMFYSFHCYEWLFAKNRKWLTLFEVAVICGFLFSGGLGLYSLRHQSLYRDRPRVERAIGQRDYTQLGLRRADLLGYGY
jgi:hypothetical protein